jgi:DNA-directed RNA polymerase subunit RPC12/RpoP
MATSGVSPGRGVSGPLPAPLFAVACPACGRSVAAAADAAGRAATCPCCRGRFLLPAAPFDVPAATESRTADDDTVRGRASPVPAPPPDATEPPRAEPVALPVDPLRVVGGPLPTFDIPVEMFAGPLTAAVVLPDAEGIMDGQAALEMEANVVERQARERRRARRSLMMLVIGSAILLGIVFAFTGLGQRR